MTEILAAAVLAVLGFGGLIALRYAWVRTKPALTAASLILAEIVLIGLLFIILTTNVFVFTPWLDVSLRPLAEQALGVSITIAVLGISSFIMMRAIGHNHLVIEAPLLGLLIPLAMAVLIAGLWWAQDSPTPGAAPLPTPTPTPGPSPTPTPLPTPTPTPGPSPTPAAPFTLTRHPYLGECSPDSVVIAWRTKGATSSAVKYGPTPEMDLTRSGDSTPTGDHALTVDGLEPNTTYYYRVFSDGHPLTSVKSFRTAKTAEQQAFRFAVFGDSGDGSRFQFGIAAAVQAMDPEFIIHTGDVVYPSGNVANWDPFFFVPYRNMLDNICLFAAIGNHDAEGGSTYEGALYLPHNNPAGSKRYYSFDWGNAHFIALHGPRAANLNRQLEWLQADLEQASQDPNIHWKIVFVHQPPFSSFIRYPRWTSKWLDFYGGDIIERYTPLFEEFGVDVVFAGHDHAYERTCPMLAVPQAEIQGRCATPGEDGVLYIVTGGGGHSTLHEDECGPGCPWSRFRASVHHFVNVVVEGNTLRGQAIKIDGTVIDNFTVLKE